MPKYVIGVDYGTDSARAIVVDTFNGDVLADAVKEYPRWSRGLYCNPQANQFRQHPLDYLEVLEATVTEALSKCDPGVAENVVGIGFDTTGSTPAFVNEDGTELQSSELEEEAQQQSNPFMPKPRNRNNEKDKKKQ